MFLFEQDRHRISFNFKFKGDVFYPNGMEGKKLISKYYKDEKMSQFDKEQQWLLCNKNEIMWIVGRRTDRRYSKTNKSNMKIEVS